jgi:hypothetical protein
MSLQESLYQTVFSSVSQFAGKIAERHNVDYEEIIKIWEEVSKTASPASKNIPKKTKTETKEESNVDMSDLSPERLYKCSKAELTALCKTHSKKCTGTKDVLISRLLGKDEEEAPKEKKGNKPVKTDVKKESKPSKKEPVSILKKLSENAQTFAIRKNKFGNFIHPETELVFNDKTKKVVGKQKDDGTISELTEDDIETCKKFKFQYDIPNNLDSKDDIKKVKIEELDEDSDIEIEEDEEIVVESDAEAEEAEEEEEDEEEIVDDD